MDCNGNTALAPTHEDEVSDKNKSLAAADGDAKDVEDLVTEGAAVDEQPVEPVEKVAASVAAKKLTPIVDPTRPVHLPPESTAFVHPFQYDCDTIMGSCDPRMVNVPAVSSDA